MKSLDRLFREAVEAVDAGDVASLERLLAANPGLAHARLESPGPWLREKVGAALDGFFRAPYLLWFVTEDPIRNGKLPGNIARVAEAIIDAARRENAPGLAAQLDPALRLVCWSRVAREAGVQLELVDLLLDAGASLEGEWVFEGRFGSHSSAAIYSGSFEAAERLLERGAPLELMVALCLGRWSDVERLAAAAPAEEKAGAFVQAALLGKADALRRMLALGVEPTTSSAQLQAHATALHHAVWFGSLGAVRVLVEAGADLTRLDTAHGGTPLDWARYGQQADPGSPRAEKLAEIAAYLEGGL